jgi:hypothetical protein
VLSGQFFGSDGASGPSNLEKFSIRDFFVGEEIAEKILL